jgi:hypothetical protein
VSDLSEVVDSLTGELERFRDMHAETLIEHTKERDRWAYRIRELEAALDDRRSPKAAEWKYVDDGVTLMKAALEAIPERYRDGDPNPLHHAIKEWLSRPERANAALSGARTANDTEGGK